MKDLDARLRKMLAELESNLEFLQGELNCTASAPCEERWSYEGTYLVSDMIASIRRYLQASETNVYCAMDDCPVYPCHKHPHKCHGCSSLGEVTITPPDVVWVQCHDVAEFIRPEERSMCYGSACGLY